jgi:hypothetical protein
LHHHLAANKGKEEGMSMSEWNPISTAPEYEKVDVWVQWEPSAMTMGWGDAFRVTDAYRRGGQWFHHVDSGAEKEIRSEYVTHWMAPPQPPT